MTELKLEIRDQEDRTSTFSLAGGGNATMSVTPSIDEDYWQYRVRLSDTQSIVGFPKFFTVGIGFAVEEDWNTNLPYTSDAEEIYAHIEHNKGDDSISREDCVVAIRMIQEAVRAAKASA